jgi:hypothetical protein
MNDKTGKINFIYVETCRGQRLCVLALLALEDQLLGRWRHTAELLRGRERERERKSARASMCA